MTHSTPTILIVDDQPANLQVLRAMLLNNDFNVHAAINGTLALRMADAIQPDLILLDIMMPDMDGYEVCTTLKASPATASIPVIFLSALEKPESKIRAFGVGGVDFIAKPFHAGEVLARVETHLALQQMRRELEENNRALEIEAAGRRRIAAALREREAVLHQAQAIASMGDWVYDSDRAELHISPELRRILSVEEASLSVEALARRLAPEDRARLRDAFDALCFQGTPIELDVRLPHSKKPTGVLLVRGRLVETSSDTPPQAIGIVQDITDRKQAEEALRQMARQLREAQSIARIGSWELDVHSGQSRWSAEARRLIGVDDTGSVGTDALLARIHPDDRDRTATALATAIDAGDPFDITVRVGMPDGGERLIHARALLAFDDLGQPTQLRGTLQDITAQRQAEIALRQSNLRLERTLRDLRDTQQSVVRQERLAAVGELAAGIAHDFNNLIATIILYTDLLQLSATLSPKDQERLEIVRAQGQRAAELNQQILDFTRQSAIIRQKVDLHPLIKEWRLLLGRMLPENITLRLHSKPDECVVLGDVTRLQQVVLNLAINARDAMPEGGRLTIALERGHFDAPPLPDQAMAAGDWVVVTVADTGAGMAEEILPRIFEPFFTTKEREEGHGLGLSQVLGIVSQHDGFVDVSSTLDEGTTFTIYLPALPRTDARLQPGLLQTFPLGNGERVLVVEDDEHVRSAILASLESLNYKTLEARNGRDALQLFAERGAEVDVVLSDLVMPELGGTRLLREFRAVAPTLKLVAMTGHPPALHALAHSEVDAWLNKPINLERLAHALHEVLNPP